jgi:hypothetical protein
VGQRVYTIACKQYRCQHDEIYTGPYRRITVALQLLALLLSLVMQSEMKEFRRTVQGSDKRGYCIMVVPHPSKLKAGVRFSLSAPTGRETISEASGISQTWSYSVRGNTRRSECRIESETLVRIQVAQFGRLPEWFNGTVLKTVVGS